MTGSDESNAETEIRRKIDKLSEELKQLLEDRQKNEAAKEEHRKRMRRIVEKGSECNE